jgi:hypothetical protein
MILPLICLDYNLNFLIEIYISLIFTILFIRDLIFDILKKKKSRNLMFIYQYLAFFCHKPSTQSSKLRVKFIIKAINALICLGYDNALNLS